MTQKILRLKSGPRERRWSFLATDLWQLMLPISVISTIFGILPYKMLWSNKIVFCPIRYVYSTAVTGAYLASVLFLFYQSNMDSKFAYSTVPGFLEGNCYIFVGGMVAVVTYAHYNKRKHFFEGLSNVSSRVPSDSFAEISKVVYAMNALGVFYLVSRCVNIYFWRADIIKVCRGIVVFYTTSITLLTDMLYTNSVCVLKICFHQINNSLQTMRSLMSKDEPHLLRRVYQNKQSPLLIMETKVLKEQHSKISDVLQELNMTFVNQLTGTVIMTFVEITFQLYFFIIHILQAKDDTKEKQISHSLVTIAYFTLKFVVIIWACEVTRNASSAIPASIHETLSITRDKEVQNELFALQTLQRQNTFSANGLSINAGLLTSISGSITTYLLILIQFLITDQQNKARKCDFNISATKYQ